MSDPVTEIYGVPIEMKEVPCIFGCKIAVARYAISDGCICYPDKEQDLCPQHVITAEPHGDMRAIIVYHPEMFKWMLDGVETKTRR